MLNPAEFARLITNSVELEKTIQQFPDHKDRILNQFLRQWGGCPAIVADAIKKRAADFAPEQKKEHRTGLFHSRTPGLTVDVSNEEMASILGRRHG